MIGQAYVGEAAALATALLWVLCSLAFTQAGRRVGSLPVNFLRLLMAGAMFVAYGLATRGLAVPADATGQTWGLLSLSGLAGFFLCDLCLFRSFLLIGPRLALLVMAMAPPLTALTMWAARGEALPAAGWGAMALTLGGVAWVVMERGASSADTSGARARAVGLGLALVAAGGQAAGYVLSREGMRLPGGGLYDPFAAAQIRLIAGMAAFAVTLTVSRRWGRVLSAVRHAGGMGYTLLGSIVGPFLGVGLSQLALQRCTYTAVAATLMATPPVLVLPFVMVLHRERVSPRAAAGAVLAVVGVALLMISG